MARFIPGEVLVEAVTYDLMERDEPLNQLKFHLNKAQNHMTKYANNHHLPSKIKEGDWVYLKIRPHQQASMPTRLNPKLSTKYYGPY